MKVFKWSVIITLITAAVSGTLFFVFFDNNMASTFLIAIFGNAFLSFVISLIGYYSNKRNTLIQLRKNAHSICPRCFNGFYWREQKRPSTT